MRRTLLAPSVVELLDQTRDGERRQAHGVLLGDVGNRDGLRSAGRGGHQRDEAGAPLEVVAELVPDDHTVSQFKWSSPNGPPTGVFGGTLCTASITVSQRKPIGYVIPLVKDSLGMQ